MMGICCCAMTDKLTYYKGFTIHIDGRLIKITDPYLRSTYSLECAPINSEGLDALNFAKEFIDEVLLNNKL